MAALETNTKATRYTQAPKVSISSNNALNARKLGRNTTISRLTSNSQIDFLRVLVFQKRLIQREDLDGRSHFNAGEPSCHFDEGLGK